MNLVQVRNSLLHYLDQLSALVVAVEKIDASQGEDSIYRARLADDMLPFYKQLEVSANFAMRTACAMQGRAIHYFACDSESFAGSYRQIQQTLDYIHNLEHFSELSDKPVVDQAGEQRLCLPVDEYILQFALPNFYFHWSMAYAIARQKACPIGKQNFDGLHAYSNA